MEGCFVEGKEEDQKEDRRSLLRRMRNYWYGGHGGEGETDMDLRKEWMEKEEGQLASRKFSDPQHDSIKFRFALSTIERGPWPASSGTVPTSKWIVH